MKVFNLSISHCGRDAIAKFFFRRWGHLSWPGDLTFGNLHLNFSGKLRKSCPNSYAKNLRGVHPPVERGLICVQKFILKMTRVMTMTWRVKIRHFSRHLSLFCKFQLLFFDRFRSFEKCSRAILRVLCENLTEKHEFHHKKIFSTFPSLTTLSRMTLTWNMVIKYEWYL